MHELLGCRSRVPSFSGMLILAAFFRAHGGGGEARRATRGGAPLPDAEFGLWQAVKGLMGIGGFTHSLREDVDEGASTVCRSPRSTPTASVALLRQTQPLVQVSPRTASIGRRRSRVIQAASCVSPTARAFCFFSLHLYRAPSPFNDHVRPLHTDRRSHGSQPCLLSSLCPTPPPFHARASFLSLTASLFESDILTCTRSQALLLPNPLVVAMSSLASREVASCSVPCTMRSKWMQD